MVTPNDAIISLTDSARNRLSQFSIEDERPFLTATSDGCAGNKIVMETIKHWEVSSHDEFLTVSPDVMLIVDGENLHVLKDVCVDYVTDTFGGKFVFTRGDYVYCGCGQSFTCDNGENDE